MVGIRTDLEIRENLTREVTQERWTSLDSQIAIRLEDGRFDLSSAAEDRDGFERSLVVGRLRHLRTMGLAERVAGDTWRIAPTAEQTLRTLGEHGDIIRTMQRALGRGSRELRIFEPHQATPRNRADRRQGPDRRIVGSGVRDR